MKYEKELMKVMPELKRFLGKLSWRLIGLIEDEEIFSQAIEKVCEVVQKKEELRNPEQFIKGTFWMQVRRIQTDAVRERNNRIRYESEMKHYKEAKQRRMNAEEILAELDRFAEGESNTIWESIKKHPDSIRNVMDELNVPESNVHYHKRKMREKYEKLILSYSA